MNEAALIKLGQMLGTLAVPSFVFLSERSSLKRQNRELKKRLKMSTDQTLYLASILDKEGIELDQFDLIALSSLAQQ